MRDQNELPGGLEGAILQTLDVRKEKNDTYVDITTNGHILIIKLGKGGEVTADGKKIDIK